MRTPLEYVTEWRMQKAMQLLEQRDKKLIDVARSVGYESDAAFSKAFKRVVGANPSAYVKRGFEDQGNAARQQWLQFTCRISALTSRSTFNSWGQSFWEVERYGPERSSNPVWSSQGLHSLHKSYATLAHADGRVR